MSQRSFASAEYALKKKRTRREEFLAEMERIVPWARLEAAIAPSYPRSGRVGRPPIGAPKMLRMYCLQKWARLLEQAKQLKASVRAKVEDPFQVVKNLLGHRKVRYKGLANLVIAKQTPMKLHAGGSS
jgi:hypothetical protein